MELFFNRPKPVAVGLEPRINSFNHFIREMGQSQISLMAIGSYVRTHDNTYALPTSLDFLNARCKICGGAFTEEAVLDVSCSSAEEARLRGEEDSKNLSHAIPVALQF